MIAKDPKIAREAGTGFLTALGLIILAVNVARNHLATAICIIVFAVMLFIVIIRLAIRADNAIDGVRRIVDTVDMSERHEVPVGSEDE